MNEVQEAAGSGKKFAGMEIPSELTRANFFNMYLATLFIACLMVVPAILQPAFLKDVIAIPEAQAGSINSGLQNMSQVATLLFVGLIGILSDRVGRRILAIIGFLVCGVFYIAFGYAKDISLLMGVTSMGGQIFVTYVIRFIVGFGLILGYPQFITLVADYTFKKDRGKGMALNGVMMGLGSMIVFGVLAQVARRTGLMSMFYMSGALGFLGAIVSRLWLKDRMPKEKPKKLGPREIYREVSKSLALKVSYVTTFVARPDIVVIATLLIVWMVYVADKFGLDPVKATARGGIVMIAMALVSFVAFPIIGILLDKWGRVQVLISCLIIGGIGFCLIGATENPFSPAMYFWVSLMGIGMAGAVVGANTLASDAAPRQLLGSILGGLNTMQPIGILIFLQVGGFLFDKVGYWSPFVLKGVADIACGLWIFAVRKNVVVPKREGGAHG